MALVSSIDFGRFIFNNCFLQPPFLLCWFGVLHSWWITTRRTSKAGPRLKLKLCNVLKTYWGCFKENLRSIRVLKIPKRSRSCSENVYLDLKTSKNKLAKKSFQKCRTAKNLKRAFYALETHCLNPLDKYGKKMRKKVTPCGNKPNSVSCSFENTENTIRTMKNSEYPLASLGTTILDVKCLKSGPFSLSCGLEKNLGTIIVVYDFLWKEATINEIFFYKTNQRKLLFWLRYCGWKLPSK